MLLVKKFQLTLSYNFLYDLVLNIMLYFKTVF